MATTIWIIDDDESVREVLSTIMERLGYAYRVFGDSAQALSEYERGKADVIICDVRMPAMDGITFTRKIVQVDRAVKIMLLTGFPSIDDAVEAIRAGAFDYLTKPFRMEEIRIRVERALENRDLAGRLTTNRWLTWILIAFMPVWFLLGFFLGRILPGL